MTSRGNVNVSSTDVLIAMLSGDLRGSWGEEGESGRKREHIDPAASTPLPVATDEGEPPGPEDPR